MEISAKPKKVNYMWLNVSYGYQEFVSKTWIFVVNI